MDGAQAIYIYIYIYILYYYLGYSVDQINIFNIKKYLYITKLYFSRKQFKLYRR